MTHTAYSFVSHFNLYHHYVNKTQLMNNGAKSWTILASFHLSAVSPLMRGTAHTDKRWEKKAKIRAQISRLNSAMLPYPFPVISMYSVIPALSKLLYIQFPPLLYYIHIHQNAMQLYPTWAVEHCSSSFLSSQLDASHHSSLFLCPNIKSSNLALPS